jgi:hypothetical protein
LAAAQCFAAHGAAVAGAGVGAGREALRVRPQGRAPTLLRLMVALGLERVAERLCPRPPPTLCLRFMPGTGATCVLVGS